MQREFRKIPAAAACASIFAIVILFAAAIDDLPDRTELGPRETPLRFERITLGGQQVGPFAIADAWRLHSDDPRLGGISALAIDGGKFVALSDSSVVIRFPKPGSIRPTVTLDELPSGPGDPGFKYNRDSEAMAGDPRGRGWWIAFENRNALWLYDRTFGEVLERRSIDPTGFGRNRGVEGLVAGGGKLVLFPERGGQAVGEDGRRIPIRGLSGWVSDAVQLAGNRVLIANRTPTPIGLSNRLALLRRDRNGYRKTAEWRIPVDRLDNVEALAVEPQPNGALRLWMMTDNNLQQRRATLLIALELKQQLAR